VHLEQQSINLTIADFNKIYNHSRIYCKPVKDDFKKISPQTLFIHIIKFKNTIKSGLLYSLF
jgi:hypothetical protein